MAHLAVVWSLITLTGVGSGLFLWGLLHPPQPIGWQPVPSWLDRTLQHLDQRLRARWTPQTRQRAEILAMPPWQVVGLYALAALGGGVVAFDLSHNAFVVLLGAGLVAWKGPAWLIGQQFHTRQKFLARDFPPLVLMLRIYLDLDEPLPVALAHTRPALSRVGQLELNRLLSALQMGARHGALKSWARRTGLTPYALLADTLAQGWDQGLTAEALTPLDTFIKSSREQGTRALTDRLDGMATIVPVIAAFGVMAVLLYALLIGSGMG
uniref:Putative type II secretion system protein n=1 Tax=Sulfobacillus thermotolerans TaxID=338644 RepID=G5CJ62_9FIRM|nr:hypothetical protein [Sulfobacillus thermotolerans]AEP14339.1 putative type II secretion system protein [Sulfobacillus thermotolerans]